MLLGLGLYIIIIFFGKFASLFASKSFKDTCLKDLTSRNYKKRLVHFVLVMLSIMVNCESVTVVRSLNVGFLFCIMKDNNNRIALPSPSIYRSLEGPTRVIVIHNSS